MGTKTFTYSLVNEDFWLKNGQIWHFGPNISFFGPFGLMADQNTMGTRFLGGYVGIKTFASSRKKTGFLARNILSWAHIGLVSKFGAL